MILFDVNAEIGLSPRGVGVVNENPNEDGLDDNALGRLGISVENYDTEEPITTTGLDTILDGTVGSVLVNDDMDVFGQTRLGELNVDGHTSLNGDLTVTGNLNVLGSSTVFIDTISPDVMDLKDDYTTVVGDLYATNAEISILKVKVNYLEDMVKFLVDEVERLKGEDNG